MAVGESDKEESEEEESDEESGEKPKKKEKPVVYLYHWLDFGWCCSRRGSYRNFYEDGHPKYRNAMPPRDIALFKMIQEYKEENLDFL